MNSADLASKRQLHSRNMFQIKDMLPMPQSHIMLLQEIGMDGAEVGVLSLNAICCQMDSSSDGTPSSGHPYGSISSECKAGGVHFRQSHFNLTRDE